MFQKENSDHGLFTNITKFKCLSEKCTLAKEGELGLKGELVFLGFKFLETILIIYKLHMLIITQKIGLYFKIYLFATSF